MQDGGTRMKTLIKTVGVIVVCLAMYAIPILIACSFCLNWDILFKFLLTSVGLIELSALCTWVYMEVEG